MSTIHALGPGNTQACETAREDADWLADAADAGEVHAHFMFYMDAEGRIHHRKNFTDRLRFLGAVQLAEFKIAGG